MSVRKHLSLFLIVFTAFVGFTGCDDEDDNVVTPAAKAKVLVVHASPDAPGVDIIVDGTVAKSNLTYPTNTGYVEVTAGTRNVKVNATGTSTTVIEGNVPVEAGKNYSVFAADTLGSIEPVIFTDDLTSPAAGKSHVRFIHLSPDAPAVDITLFDGTIVFGGYEFREGSPFTPLNVGTYNLQVRLAGTSTVVLALPGITIAEGKIYTVFAKGLVAGSGTQALGAEIIVNK